MLRNCLPNDQPLLLLISEQGLDFLHVVTPLLDITN